MNLGDTQIEVLKRAAKHNNGIIDIKWARNVYSSKSAAIDSIEGLKDKGIVNHYSFGKFEIVRLPKKLKHEIKEEMEK